MDDHYYGVLMLGVTGIYGVFLAITKLKQKVSVKSLINQDNMNNDQNIYCSQLVKRSYILSSVVVE